MSGTVCTCLTGTKKGSRSSWRHEQQLQQRAAATQIFGTLVVLTVVGMSQVLTLRHVPFWLFFALSAASLFLSARVAARVAVRPLQQPGQAPKTASSPRTLSPPPRARFSVWHVAVAVLVMLLLGTTLLGAVRHAFDLATGGAVGTTTVSLSQRTWQQRAALSVSLLCWPLIVGGVALLCLALPSLTDRSSSYRRITSHNEQHLLVSERVAAFLNRETPRFDIQSITSLAAACVTLPGTLLCFKLTHVLHVAVPPRGVVVILAMHWRARDAFLHLSENESIDTVTSLRAYLLQLCHLAALTGFMLLAGVSATRLMLHSVSHAFRKSLLSSFD
ncbi:MAG: hypothetical protein MHM6MM_000260 [Cercozoa sp. M6MM]